jgi:hypothetical protein
MPESIYRFANFFLAKNLALAGVKSVTIYDPEPVTIADLSSQACLFCVVRCAL